MKGTLAVSFIYTFLLFTSGKGEGAKNEDKVIKRKRRGTNDLIVTIPINDAIRQDFVDWHNLYRKQVMPEASNMRKMIWDYDLENLAKDHSRECSFVHRQEEQRETSEFSLVGENLARGTAPPTRAAEYAVKAWFAEEEDFTFDDSSCTPKKACGHYTQLVWWESYKIGCGMSFCRNLIQERYNGFIYVCNYGPAGNTKLINYDGTSSIVRPYAAGPQCSGCEGEFPLCVDRLCSKPLDD